jgi:hypothetical protein
MDAQILRTLGGIAGLAGLAIGMILLLYREIIRKNIFPTLTRTDSYRLLRIIAVLSWSVAMFGILCWVWSTAILHRNQAQPTVAAAAPAAPVEAPVVAGTVVDQATNLGIGQATVTVDGQTSTSEDSGNFRIVLPANAPDRVRLTVTRSGYLETDQSVAPPTHDLIVQMRPR